VLSWGGNPLAAGRFLDVSASGDDTKKLHVLAVKTSLTTYSA
jgi:hypothetical protein